MHDGCLAGLGLDGSILTGRLRDLGGLRDDHRKWIVSLYEIEKKLVILRIKLEIVAHVLRVQEMFSPWFLWF